MLTGYAPLLTNQYTSASNDHINK